MIFRSTDLEGARLAAMDGPIGEVVECFFDDRHWTVRYLVVDTGGWLSGRHVLISPGCVRDVDAPGRRIIVVLSREQVERSPEVDRHQPISRRQEATLLAHYGMEPYWLGPFTWGPVPLPAAPVPRSAVDAEVAARQEADEERDAHLHSTRDVAGYAIEASDGEVGHVVDFLIDDQSWTIRWIVVDTGSWLPGKKVLLSPEWIEEVAWETRGVRGGLTREQIRDAPEYHPHAPVHRDYEQRLFEYYRRPAYWKDAA